MDKLLTVFIPFLLMSPLSQGQSSQAAPTDSGQCSVVIEENAIGSAAKNGKVYPSTLQGANSCIADMVDQNREAQWINFEELPYPSIAPSFEDCGPGKKNYDLKAYDIRVVIGEKTLPLPARLPCPKKLSRGEKRKSEKNYYLKLSRALWDAQPNPPAPPREQ